MFILCQLIARKTLFFFHETIASVTRESSVLSVSSVGLFLSSTGYGLNCFNGKVTMPLKAFVLHLIRYKIVFVIVFVIVAATKVIHRKSEVNNIISMCKSLQITLHFPNFAQREVIVRWAPYSRSTVIVQPTDDHQSVDRWSSYDNKLRW